MKILRNPQWVLVLAFLGILVSVPTFQGVLDARRGEWPQALDVFRRKPTTAHLRTYERTLEDASWAAKAARPWILFAQFEWLKDGGEKALVGRNGWFFYRPGFDYLVERGAATTAAGSDRDPVPAIVAFRDALAARGIQLLVLPVPNKESVYPELLTPRAGHLQGALGPQTRDLLTRLSAAGVHTVNLFDLYAAEKRRAGAAGPPLYLVQDSHWSPRGLDLAAQAVARRLVEEGWATPGRVGFREQPAPVQRIGDVPRMLQVPRIEERLRPEIIPCVQVIRADDVHPYTDDPNSEILVLGDSFLRIFEQDEPGAAGFIAHLAKHLQQPLTSLVNDGGASTLVRQELHRRPALLTNKKVVLWEFVERDLRLGTEGWQVVPLPPATAGK